MNNQELLNEIIKICKEESFDIMIKDKHGEISVSFATWIKYKMEEK